MPEKLLSSVRMTADRAIGAARHRALGVPMTADAVSRVGKQEQRRLSRVCGRASAEGKKRLLMVSQIAAFDKGSCACWRQLTRELQGWSFFHLSETPMLSGETLKERLACPFHRTRFSAFPLGYPTRVTGSCAAQTPATREAAENLFLRFDDLDRTGAAALAMYLKRLYVLTIRSYRPDIIMTWNAFTPAHRILREAAEEEKVPLVFMEFGLLPGTFSFDREGQMGQSLLAKEPPVLCSRDMLTKADQIIGFLGAREMNRNEQSAPGGLAFDGNGGPIVTFFGQNDFESGIVPYTEEARRWHSPIYPSTASALKDLAEICRGNGWRLVFRDHPGMRLKDEQIPEGVLLARDCNLFELLRNSDLAVVLMSQTSYEAALHGVNVLLLGRNQMSGKGCVWETGGAETVEDAIRRALEQGWTIDMQMAFRHHIAHAAGNILYDDGEPRELRYGRPLREVADFLKETLEEYPERKTEGSGS